MVRASLRLMDNIIADLEIQHIFHARFFWKQFVAPILEVGGAT